MMKISARHSKRGEGVISVLVTLFIGSILATMLWTSTQYMSRNRVGIRERTYFNQTINNVVQKSYLDDWDVLEDTVETIDIPDGVLTIHYGAIKFHEDHLTNLLPLTIKYRNHEESIVTEKNYELERSVVDDE